MKLANVRASLSVSFFLFFAAPGGPALAHTQNGSLGDGEGATDFYQLTCTDDGNGVPASLLADVMNRSPAPAPVVSVLVHRAISAINSSDATAGDATASPLVFVNAGDGVYNVFVTKAAVGSVNYTLTLHCMSEANGGGLHTGTTIVFRQNQ